MLVYLDHLQDWLEFSDGLSIFLILILWKASNFVLSGHILENVCSELIWSWFCAWKDGLEFDMLVYPDRFQSWYILTAHSLLIFLILAL